MAGMIGIPKGILRSIAVCFCLSASLYPASYALDSDPPALAVTASTAALADALPDAPEAQNAVTEKGLPIAILKKTKSRYGPAQCGSGRTT